MTSEIISSSNAFKWNENLRKKAFFILPSVNFQCRPVKMQQRGLCEQQRCKADEKRIKKLNICQPCVNQEQISDCMGLDVSHTHSQCSAIWKRQTATF